MGRKSRGAGRPKFGADRPRKARMFTPARAIWCPTWGPRHCRLHRVSFNPELREPDSGEISADSKNAAASTFRACFGVLRFSAPSDHSNSVGPLSTKSGPRTAKLIQTWPIGQESANLDNIGQTPPNMREAVADPGFQIQCNVLKKTARTTFEVCSFSCRRICLFVATCPPPHIPHTRRRLHSSHRRHHFKIRLRTFRGLSGIGGQRRFDNVCWASPFAAGCGLGHLHTNPIL